MTLVSFAMVAVGVAGFFAVGHAVLAGVVRRTPLYWFERWALAYLVGMSALSWLWFASSQLFTSLGPLVLTPIVGAAALFAARRTPPRFETREPGFGAVEVALAAGIAVECGLLMAAALHSSLGFDGLFNFEMKARLMFEHGSGRLPVSYLSDPSRNWSHPQYPLLVPFGEFWIYTWLGRVDQAAVKVLFPPFFFCLIALVGGAVRRISGRRAALIAGAALGLMPPLTLLPGAASGYADVPLAAAFAGAAGFGILALRTHNVEAAALTGLLSAVATWTKSEGLVLGGCAAVLALVLSRVPTSTRAPIVPLRQFSVVVWLPLLAAVPWLLVQRMYGIAAVDFLPISAASTSEGLRRVSAILDLTLRELLRPGHWGLTWPAWLIAIFLVIQQRRPSSSDLFVVATVALPLMLYVLPFLFSSWTDPTEHLRSALPRLLVPLAPVALLFAMTTLFGDRGQTPFFGKKGSDPIRPVPTT